MPAPANTLKSRLAAGETLHGLWLSSGLAYMADIAGGAGFDWCLVDGEHGPGDFSDIVGQVQMLRGHDTETVVRVPWGEDWMLKKVLDSGAQSVLVPMVESGADAERLVRATRYPPHGHRGVGAAAAAASRYGAIADYISTADAQICLMVQVESRRGYDALDDILAVEGVDVVFIGPADLSADLGHPGDMEHDAVQAAIRDILGRTARAGKVPGILSTREEVTRRYIEWGARFVCVGLDVSILSAELRRTARHWRGGD